MRNVRRPLAKRALYEARDAVPTETAWQSRAAAPAAALAGGRAGRLEPAGRARVTGLPERNAARNGSDWVAGGPNARFAWHRMLTGAEDSLASSVQC